VAAPVISGIDDVTFGASTVSGAQIIDAAVTVTDADENFNGGTLVVSGLLTGDVVAVSSSGNITVVGASIQHLGTEFATFTGGSGADLVITFDADATAAIITEMVQAMTYSSGQTSPVVTRTLTFTLTDAAAEVGSDIVAINIIGDAAANALTGTSGDDTINGGALADTLRGKDGADTLNGDAGDDRLVGEGGSDILNGGEGADLLYGGTGGEADAMTGGNGNDTYIVDAVGDTTDETGTDGTDLVKSYISWTLGTDVENLTLLGTVAIDGTGTIAANVITGNDGNNVLNGDAGGDTINGGGGDDTINGGTEADTLTGSNGNDTIDGGDGDDIIDGGNGNDTLTGGANADDIIGGAGNDSLDGGTGADDLAGGVGDDTYVVDDAGDLVTEAASGGTDAVSASITYTLTGNTENLTLTGGGAIDGTGNTLNNTITGNGGANVLTGDDGNDTLSGGADVDTLSGGNGADSLDGGTGADSLTGGAGNDTYYVDDAGDTITEAAAAGYDIVYASASYTLGAGDDIQELLANGAAGYTLGGNEVDNRIVGSDGIDVISGGDGDDDLYGGLSADTLTGGNGYDYIDGGAGADGMTGGAGNDTYIVDNAGDTVTEGVGAGAADAVQTSLASYKLGANLENLTGTSAGGQTLTGNTLSNHITGGDGNDVLVGNTGDDQLVGGLGNDTLNGGRGIDVMTGGDGDDTYIIEDTTETIVEAGGGGTDTVKGALSIVLAANLENLVLLGASTIDGTGNSENNVITGNKVANTLNGLDGADTLNGDAGNDALNGGDGADTLNGGRDNDIYYVDDAGDTVNEDAGQGTDTVYASTTFTLSDADVENLILSGVAADGTGNASANTISGNASDNTLSGLGGADTLSGGDGADTLNGGDGNDSLNGGLGADTLNGGANNDTLAGDDGVDALLGGAGNDTYIITASDDASDTITENALEGTDSVQAAITWTLATNVENLTLTGAGDIDGTGNASGNVITGNGGANTLGGLAGEDVISGAGGDDSINGGQGNDSMTGGAGYDTFVILGESVLGSEIGAVRDADRILDLSFAGGDRIDLSAIDADANTVGNQNFDFVGAFTGAAGEATLTYFGAGDFTQLRLDVDGDGVFDYQMNINGDITGVQTLLDGSEPAGTGGWLGFNIAP